jgi:hypothetical protein
MRLACFEVANARCRRTFALAETRVSGDAAGLPAHGSSGLVLAGAASASLPPQPDLGVPASKHLRLPSQGSGVFAVVVVLAADPPVARLARLPDVALSPLSLTHHPDSLMGRCQDRS